MKATFRVLMVLVLAFVVLLPTTLASAKETRVEFTGYEICTHEDLVFSREWYPGHNVQDKDGSETCSDIADTPMMTGTDYVFDMSGRWVGDRNFMINGKIRMETDEGGVWVGSWEMPAHATTIKIIAHGEGLYEGMQLHWFITITDDIVFPFSGYISSNEGE